MFQPLLENNKLIFQESKNLSLIDNNQVLLNPIIENNNENNLFLQKQNNLLSEFLSFKDSLFQNEIIDCMLTIFNPQKENYEETSDEDHIFIKNAKKNDKEKKSKFYVENKSNFFSEEKESKSNSSILEVEQLINNQDSINPIDFNTSNKIFNTECRKFLCIKRKNSETIKKENKSYSNAKDNKQKTEKFIKSYNDNSKTKETNEITQKINIKNNNTHTQIEKKIDYEKQKSSKFQYRLDYYKKAFKVNCFKALTNYLNNLISKCNLPKEFKGRKIFKPNNESFTANAKEEDNYKFLFMQLKDIFCYVKNEKSNEGISLQKRNKELIDNICNYINQKGENLGNELQNLKKYLNMTVEEYIKIYYETKEFKKFCDEEKIKYYDEEFIKEKKFSILEKYGFLKLIKMHQINHFSNGFCSIHLTMNGINSV